MKYELEWQYSDNLEPKPGTEPYFHFVFLLRFPDIPPGKGHVAHFCFNVLENPETDVQGINVVCRGFLTCVPLSKSTVNDFVEAAVDEAFVKSTLEEAIAALNKSFIFDDEDFSDKFSSDLLGRDELLALIEDAFIGVNRDDGITLHQAVVIDDYGTDREFIAAKIRDTEVRWQDIPDVDIATNPSIFSFLDAKGFRYYLPAYMSWSVKNFENTRYDSSFFTYLAVLPTIAPREVGRGLGTAFDLDGFIKEHLFNKAQVNAIYRFLCFIAIKADYRIDEDYYAALLKWRSAAI